MKKLKIFVLSIMALTFTLLVASPKKAYAAGFGTAQVSVTPSGLVNVSYSSKTLGEVLQEYNFDYSSLNDSVSVWAENNNYYMAFTILFDKNAPASSITVNGESVTVNYPCICMPLEGGKWVYCLVNGKVVVTGEMTSSSKFIHTNAFGYNTVGSSAYTDGNGSLKVYTSNGLTSAPYYTDGSSSSRTRDVVYTSIPVFNDLAVAKNYAVTGTVSDNSAVIGGGSYVPTPTPTPVPDNPSGGGSQYSTDDFGISASDIASSGDLFSWIKNIFEKISFHMFDGRSIVGDEWFADKSDTPNPMDTYTPAEDSFFSYFYEIIAGNEGGEGFGSFISGCMQCIGVTINGDGTSTFSGIALLYLIAFGLLIGAGVFSRLL